MPHEDDALAAEYVLGVLPHAERLGVAQRMRSDARLMSRIQFWENALVPLGLRIAPVRPPARVLQAIESRLFAPAPRRFWRGLLFWQGLSVASLTALAVMVALYVRLPLPAPLSSPTYVAELSGPAGAVRLAALYDAGTGVLKLNRTEGSAAAGRDYELWLIEGQNKPISLGVLPAGQRSAILLPETLRRKIGSAILAISDEPAGGSPTGQPTGAVLATGKVSAI